MDALAKNPRDADVERLRAALERAKEALDQAQTNLESHRISGSVPTMDGAEKIACALKQIKRLEREGGTGE